MATQRRCRLQMAAFAPQRSPYFRVSCGGPSRIIVSETFNIVPIPGTGGIQAYWGPLAGEAFTMFSDWRA